MRRSPDLMVILLILLASVTLVSAQRPVPVTFHQGEVGNVNGTTQVTDGFTTASLQNVIAGGHDGTLNFEASQDTTNFVAVFCRNLETFAFATTGTGNSLWLCELSGLRRFRVRISGTTVGSATITGYVK